MLTDTQLLPQLQTIVQEQLALYNQPRTVQAYNSIPDTNRIPIENQSHWLRIPDVVCVFVDMKGSTQLSASLHDQSTAGAYQLFTGTAVRLFNELETPYVDVRGDGVFGMFNRDQVYRALVAAVSFKTFATEVFVPTIKQKTGLDIGAHIGIDQRTVLVRKIGLKRRNDRTDRQNEVWAGKPVNMASKLAGMGEASQLIVSDRYYAKIDNELARMSCGCPNDIRVPLWTPLDVSEDPKFDFTTAYLLKSQWCKLHGKEYCEAILALD